TSLTPIWRIASTMFWPCETRTSTCLSFATFSSGLYRFLAIAVLLDVKDIPQVGPLQWGWINHPSDNEAYSGMRRDKCGENEETLISSGKMDIVGNMRMSCAVDTHPARLVLTTPLLHQPKQLACGFSILMRVVKGDPQRVRSRI